MSDDPTRLVPGSDTTRATALLKELGAPTNPEFLLLALQLVVLIDIRVLLEYDRRSRAPSPTPHKGSEGGV